MKSYSHILYKYYYENLIKEKKLNKVIVVDIKIEKKLH